MLQLQSCSITRTTSAAHPSRSLNHAVSALEHSTMHPLQPAFISGKSRYWWPESFFCTCTCPKTLFITLGKIYKAGCTPPQSVSVALTGSKLFEQV